MFEIGAVVAGYVIESRLGRGSSADVYRARRPAESIPVALKVFHNREADDRVAWRLEREFSIASRLRHPHIVAMYEHGELRADSGGADEAGAQPTRLWLSMQYVDGPESTVLIPGPDQEPDVDAVVRVSTQIGSALDYAHQMDVIHRDVKPANILLSSDQRSAFLTDFGIAQLLDDAKPLARNGRVRGSIAYAAPELLTAQQLLPQTDGYALACTMFEWLTGLPPYPRPTTFAITYAHLHDEVPTLTSRRSWLPTALNSVFAKALAKDPSARYDSCTEFVAIVAKIMRDVPASQSRRRRWPAWSRR
ncbi:serine/threonine-protein kinase [Mycolicibacterium mucogenicum]|uniref:non-specific serine/threonine protein kinase n=1 Tax=Mycolicibacterium mucogenicum DSM 44124 TaxID=1226753 RepID=A0A8H2PHM5_MYCMU|nr:serine/threonine-protein kinase [Mycolicibacterium mucogenicum]KAB7753050.1 serine/threonine protein kinase [Mycolicibacterium mucogenicum DSM 44124]QPG67323.1 serine/threonine protein kinase [Mycolicibacterium mucogenicum DSM 44124]